MMLTSAEVAAHLRLAEGERADYLLLTFHARCQNCRRRLVVSPWDGGKRRWRCSHCNHDWFECC